MRVCNLGSGSRGNSTYIESGGAKILVDCGLAIHQMESRLKFIGIEPKDIDAIFITHEHTDHIQSLKQFINKYNSIVYIHKNGRDAVLSRQNISLLNVRTFDTSDFIFKDLIITPFELSHDSDFCVGYTFNSYGQKISIATDTGYLPSGAIDSMFGSDIIYIESNHNEKLLMNNEVYPMKLKKRILSRFGHISNADCAKYIATLYNGGTRQFVLSHLSEKNNTPQIAFRETVDYLKSLNINEGQDLFIDIANQDKVGTMFEIKSENKKMIEM